MNEKIVCGPWICRMSLDDFYLKADDYLTVLKARQKSLSSTRKLYRAGKDIHPKQYKRTMNLLHKIGETVQKFCKLLSTTAELPEAVVPLRYVLATTLYDLDEQLNELMTVVVRFRTRYYVYSKKTVRQQQEIQCRL